jgi:hypothetical protein
VDDLIGVDLGYAPPFSPVWDPVLVAARKAAENCKVADNRQAADRRMAADGR